MINYENFMGSHGYDKNIVSKNRYVTTGTSTFRIPVFYLAVGTVLWFLWQLSAVSFKSLKDEEKMTCRTNNHPEYFPWYGISAYPKITGKNETWKWITQFAKSVRSREKHMPMLHRSVLSQRRSTRRVLSVRFPNVTTLEVEDLLLQRILSNGSTSSVYQNEIDIRAVPRHECGYATCSAGNLSFALRPASLLKLEVFYPVVIIHGMVSDISGMNEIITTLNHICPEFLVTAITVLPDHISEKEENSAVDLYDFLHRLYFDHNWIPDVLLEDTCHNPGLIRHGCKLVVMWSRWNHTQILNYIPPAGNGSPEMTLQRLSSFINHPELSKCEVRQKFGGHIRASLKFGFMDGQYTVCLDSLRAHLIKGTCLVYSFGIQDDWSFDDQMHRFGCEVHSFDPSLGISSYQRSTRHWFHNLGLRTGKGFGNSTWEMATYTEITRLLGHEGRMVNVLKMDVEGAEWSFILDAMKTDLRLDNIDQLVMEIHPIGVHGSWREQTLQQSLLLHYLEKQGFVLFHTRRNVGSTDLRALDYSRKIEKRNRFFMSELSFLRPARCVRL